ncbi:MAG: ATPase, T2SS/T4P/T4SS family [bacterium]
MVGLRPGVGGEAVTIRLFDRLEGEARLDERQFSPGLQAELARVLASPHGVLLFAGPSASGKTTTLYTALRMLLASAGGTRRALTVEDPVEYRLAGVVQLEPDPHRGVTGAELLRAALRQDADILVVGEARDAESVALMLRAGLTGHLVLGTVHAGNAAEAWARLAELGAEPAVLGRAVRGILAQRLLRRRCCAAGCPACGGTGHRGRTAVAELRVPDASWQAGAPADDGLRADAARLVAAGVVDAAEVERVLGR